jgi:hypothetical protein
MYSEINRINPEMLFDKIKDQEDIQYQDNIKNNSLNNKYVDIVIEKYLKITRKDFLEERIAKMLYRNDNNISLLCDNSLLYDDVIIKGYGRDVFVTTPLCKLSNTYKETRSIIEIIKQTIPKDYRVYYHYNFGDGNHGNGGMDISTENYEISIYRNSLIYDPWCEALCCWNCSFRFSEKFDKEIRI